MRAGRLRWSCGVVLGLGVALLAGCRTPQPFPPVNVAQPGWRTENGQAIWTPGRNAKEVAGEMLVALGPHEESLVQFMKTPFPFVTARQQDGAWQIEFGAAARRDGGPGQAPSQFIWFQFARARAGHPLTAPWEAAHPAPGRWEIWNRRTAERLEVHLPP